MGGGFALAGVALSQVFTARAERQRYTRSLRDRRHAEQHEAFVDLVKACRRVQRALVDLDSAPADSTCVAAVAQEVDRLTESVATLRLVVTSRDLVATIERFEEHAKQLERARRPNVQVPLRLTPLIETLQAFEAARDRP